MGRRECSASRSEPRRRRRRSDAQRRCSASTPPKSSASSGSRRPRSSASRKRASSRWRDSGGHVSRAWLLGLVILVLVASACGGLKVGKEFPSPDAAQIKANITDKAALVQMFGDPYQAGIDNGDLTWRWFYAQSGASTTISKDLTVPLVLKRTVRSEEHTSELQSQFHLVCRLLLEKKDPELTALLGVHVLLAFVRSVRGEALSRQFNSHFWCGVNMGSDCVAAIRHCRTEATLR